jgi:hypothetical protein
MSQLVERFSQPEMGGAHFIQRRLEAERLQEYGWQEPYESRGSRTVLRVLEVRSLRSTRLTNSYQVFDFSVIP